MNCDYLAEMDLLPLSTECKFWCLLLIPRSENVDDWEMHCCFVSKGCKTLFMISKHKWHILKFLFTSSDIIQLAFILQEISNREKTWNQNNYVKSLL